MNKPISKPVRTILSAVLFVFLIISCEAQTNPAPEPLVATSYNTGFKQAGNTWNSISTASDGKIYYSFSTTDADQGARLYAYDPDTDEIEYLADLTEITDGTETPTIPQGKSHGNFYEMDGKLFISTHVGVHGSVQEGETAIIREGYEPYPGGHIVSYNLTTGEFKQLATAPNNEGILTFMMDRDRGHIYGITWPMGYFIHYNVNTGEMKNPGLVSGRGEAGRPGDDFRVLGRSLFVDPEDGSVYYSTADGDIFSYSPDAESINKVEGVDLRLDYFGEQIPDQPGSMAYGWRQIVWNPSEEVAYGVHGKSGYLFRFDPREPSLEIIERITSEPSKRSGMFDQYDYGYLGFDLGRDGETLYYLTGGPIYVDGVRLNTDNNEELGYHSSVRENLHLITYNIPNKEYKDHGPVLHENGSVITDAQSIAIGAEGSIYTLGRFERNNDMEMDLVKIPNPFANQ